MSYIVRHHVKPRGTFPRAHLMRWQHLLDSRDTQIASAFRLLKQHKSRWVTLPDLGRRARCRCVTQLITNLRNHGCVVENRTEVVQDDRLRGVFEIHSWYRLLKEPKDLAKEL